MLGFFGFVMKIKELFAYVMSILTKNGAVTQNVDATENIQVSEET